MAAPIAMRSMSGAVIVHTTNRTSWFAVGHGQARGRAWPPPCASDGRGTPGTILDLLFGGLTEICFSLEKNSFQLFTYRREAGRTSLAAAVRLRRERKADP